MTGANIRTILLWCMLGFCVGMILGYAYLYEDIRQHTNGCINAFNDCAVKYYSCCFDKQFDLNIETKLYLENLTAKNETYN